MMSVSIIVLLCCATVIVGGKTPADSDFSNGKAAEFVHYVNGKNSELFAGLYTLTAQVTAMNTKRGHFWYQRKGKFRPIK